MIRADPFPNMPANRKRLYSKLANIVRNKDLGNYTIPIQLRNKIDQTLNYSKFFPEYTEIQKIIITEELLNEINLKHQIISRENNRQGKGLRAGYYPIIEDIMITIPSLYHNNPEDKIGAPNGKFEITISFALCGLDMVMSDRNSFGFSRFK
jgi:hypothetical protein